MTRNIAVAAAAAAIVALAACSKGESYNDTGLGTTAGAMATPPAAYPAPDTTTTAMPADSGDSAKWTNADSARHNATKSPPKTP
jgi:hypothetical protein